MRALIAGILMCMPSLHIRQSGSPHAKPILIVHGLSSWGRQFDPLAAYLPPDWRQAAVDLPGFGDSPSIEGFDMNQVADMVIDSAREKGIDRFRLVGHSMGAAVCVAIAQRRPDLVERLILLAPAGLVIWPEPQSSSSFARSIVRRFGLLIGAPIVAFCSPLRAKVLARLVHDPVSLSFADTIMMLTGARRADQRALNGARASLATAGISDKLASLPMPVDLIWGDDDQVVPASWADKLLAKRPDMHVEMIKGAGHALTVENPEAVMRGIVHAPWLSAEGEGIDGNA